jgi:hypothetical protein
MSDLNVLNALCACIRGRLSCEPAQPYRITHVLSHISVQSCRQKSCICAARMLAALYIYCNLKLHFVIYMVCMQHEKTDTMSPAINSDAICLSCGKLVNQTNIGCCTCEKTRPGSSRAGHSMLFASDCQKRQLWLSIAHLFNLHLDQLQGNLSAAQEFPILPTCLQVCFTICTKCPCSSGHWTAPASKE